jgi:hypothetical protein
VTPEFIRDYLVDNDIVGRRNIRGVPLVISEMASNLTKNAGLGTRPLSDRTSVTVYE